MPFQKGHNVQHGTRTKAPASFRQCVNDKCKQCIYDQKSGQGTWREQTEGCKIMDCGLWLVRPVRK